ncbi:hypothetical protein VTN77DRAFT_9244 [Rasamsonia byssochlamydoides]|uniref:uncharacterized protein n=1 Tax=Rasamsonia byssochlamydoides TaxID=89139 RepID=UPI0037441FC5
MGFLSRVITFFGLILLAHAAYSAHEHSTLYSNAARSSPASSSSLAPDLPLDITIETLVSVALVSIGLVLGAEKLKPITWSAWAGQIEREGGRRNPYRGLEQRLGFWDVRASRKEFADWMRSQDESTKG